MGRSERAIQRRASKRQRTVEEQRLADHKDLKRQEKKRPYENTAPTHSLPPRSSSQPPAVNSKIPDAAVPTKHRGEGGRKLRWAPQADEETIQYNFELRRRYREVLAGLGGDSGLIPEEVERAKVLMLRDERKRGRKLGRGAGGVLGGPLGGKCAGLPGGVESEAAVLGRAPREEVSSSADRLSDGRHDSERRKEERKKNNKRKKEKEVHLGSTQTKEKDEASADIDAHDKEQHHLSDATAKEQKDISTDNASDHNKRKRPKPSDLPTLHDERKRQKKERKEKKKHNIRKEVQVGSQQEAEKRELSKDIDHKQGCAPDLVTVQKSQSKQPVKASSSSKPSKAKYSKLKRDRKKALRKLYADTSGKGMKPELVTKAKMLIKRHDESKQKEKARVLQ